MPSYALNEGTMAGTHAGRSRPRFEQEADAIETACPGCTLIFERGRWEHDRSCPARAGQNRDYLRRQAVVAELERLAAQARPSAGKPLYGKPLRNSLKTRCKRGHLLLGANVSVTELPDGRRWRRCKVCNRELTRQPEARRKESAPGGQAALD
jgi:hypothetical protein